MIVLICGHPGFGKTTFLGFLSMEDMTINARSRYLSACNEINTLNSQGLNLSYPPYNHLVYGNFWCESHIFGFAPRTIMDFDGTDFGLLDREHKTKFIPPYSSIFLMEGQSFLDSRKSRYFRASVSRAYEIHRHYDLNIYLDCQRATLIDLNVRGISERIIECYKQCKIEFDSLGIMKKITWYLREFNSSEEYDKYLESGRNLKNYKQYSKSYCGNIGKCLNTKQNRALFYENVKNEDFCYDLVEKPNLNLDYIKKYCLNHSLSRLKNSSYYQKGV